MRILRKLELLATLSLVCLGLAVLGPQLLSGPRFATAVAEDAVTLNAQVRPFPRPFMKNGSPNTTRIIRAFRLTIRRWGVAQGSNSFSNTSSISAPATPL